MYLGEENTKRRKQIIGGISGVLAILFLFAYWQDLGNIIALISRFLVNVVLGRFRLDEAIAPGTVHSVEVLSYNFFIGFLAVFFTWLVLLANQAVLPVRGFMDTYRTAWHMILYMLRLHGPAVFVKDGEILTTKEDKREGPGVAVVDFNSAIVLEKRVPPSGFTRMFFETLQSLLILLGLETREESPRAAGPGIVFTANGENIRGAVDLRKQFRAKPDVTAYTRDGIEVKSRVWSIFTIGQDPDIVQVTYAGEPKPENLRVVTLEAIPDGHYRITGLADDLDRHDRDEIHHFFHVAQHSASMLPYAPPPDPNTLPTYNRDRVFTAVFSEARGDKDQLLSWADLPARVGASLFRELISTINYDQLYQIGSSDPIPLPKYKAGLRIKMRNEGLLSFRLLLHKSGQPIQLRKVYAASDLLVSAVHPLTFPKILRDRGIKVIMAGFGDIAPVNDAIYQRRLESWRGTWMRETDKIKAVRELEAIRVRNHARAQAQQELLVSLNGILQDPSISQEVMAVRILQSLDNLATNTQTKDLLPGGTLDVMKTAREWLMPGDVRPALQMPPIMPIDGDQL